MNTANCIVCNKAESSPCKNCGLVYYCSKDHQKKDWEQHKATCRPFKIESSDKMGRYIVATRDLKPGELILNESPMVVGPLVDTRLVCLGCHRLLDSDYDLCSKCNIAPVCNILCESKLPHEYECAFYQKWFCDATDIITSNLQLVTPLRCLTLDDSAFEEFIKLESHLKERQNNCIWNYYQEKVVNVLKTVKGFEDGMLLQKICSILDVNSFEIRGNSFPEYERLRGIYPQAALMSHDCIGNTHLSVDDSYIMTIHAGIAIKTGDPILFNYASPLESTQQRQVRLKEGKYFMCTCRRCLDPTELGTYMGSIVCSRCQEGFVILQDEAWVCEKCKKNYHSRLINMTVAAGWSLIEHADSRDSRSLENLLKKCLTSFPETSAVVIEIKQKLVASYRDAILADSNISRNVLKRKITLCQELLELLNKIEPGISRLRGITLYELYKPMMMLSNKEHEVGELNLGDFAIRLSECESYLKEAISVLLYEPPNSPEGRLLQVAIGELKELRKEMMQVTILEENKEKSMTGRIRKAKKGKK